MILKNYKKMIEESKRYIKEYNLSVMGEKYRKLYLSLK